jgi:hypothetical protein
MMVIDIFDTRVCSSSVRGLESAGAWFAFTPGSVTVLFRQHRVDRVRSAARSRRIRANGVTADWMGIEVRLANRIDRLELQTGTDGNSYRVVVSAAAMGLDVPRCIQILEARGVLSHRPGFSLLDLMRRPLDLSQEEWAELGGGQ